MTTVFAVWDDQASRTHDPSILMSLHESQAGAEAERDRLEAARDSKDTIPTPRYSVEPWEVRP